MSMSSNVGKSCACMRSRLRGNEDWTALNKFFLKSSPAGVSPGLLALDLAPGAPHTTHTATSRCPVVRHLGRRGYEAAKQGYGQRVIGLEEAEPPEIAVWVV